MEDLGVPGILGLEDFEWQKELCGADIYLLKVDKRNTRARRKICLKLKIKTPERHHLHRSGVFIINLKHISHIVLVFLLLTLNM